MYSYEDRIRGVKLYLKLGKRTAPTVRQLGYPTKNAHKSWYRAYVQSRDLQVGYGMDTVALESTGVAWIPVFEVLEQRGLQVWLVDDRSWSAASAGFVAVITTLPTVQ